jgi:hypothetical protein
MGAPGSTNWECGDGIKCAKTRSFRPFAHFVGTKTKRRNGWLTWEDSNFDIPISKNAFEMSAEFPLFWPKTRLGDFAAASC